MTDDLAPWLESYGIDLSDGPVVSAARGTGARPEQGELRRPGRVSTTRAALERRIAGALKSCIDAHGPITNEWLGSASKRVAGAVLPKEPDRRPLREIFPPRERRLDWAVIHVPRWPWFLRKRTHRLMVHVAPKTGRS